MAGQRLYLSPPHMGGREQALVSEVFASNWIAPIGPMIDLFEARLAETIGMAHVVALSSGTAALHLALRMIGIGAGDEVWGPTMTFIGGVAPILYMGATPVFLDVEGDGFLLDLYLLETELARRPQKPKVVITTDLYGHVIDGKRMRALADLYGFIWISDAAEALGANRDGVHAGAGADFAILSFNGNKIITTSGGGALASDNGEAIARARFLSTQAREPAPHYEHLTYGYNYRLSNVCAAIGVGQLEILAERVAARRAIFAAYRERLGDMAGLTFVDEPAGMTANRWLTTVAIDPALAGFDRVAAQEALEKDNIESRPMWKPMHLQPLFRGAVAIGGSNAERVFEHGLCLPSGSAMDMADIARVCGIVRGLAA
ncbi:MAG TPA: DegT/DnrJ/EryC1/StrS family aminotransferase [Sphingomonas sp.]|nr:DegT/DnrJ/EryC1/StrS family aminotransferase [Sphingomonas sp.]